MGHPNMPMYKACRLCDPYFFLANRSWRGINDNPPTSLLTDVKILLEPMVTLKFIDQETLNNLCEELQHYKDICVEKNINFSLLNTSNHCDAISNFWNENKIRILFWYDFATLCMLLVPSSASVERVFSVLKLILNDYQGSSHNEEMGILSINNPLYTCVLKM